MVGLQADDQDNPANRRWPPTVAGDEPIRGDVSPATSRIYGVFIDFSTYLRYILDTTAN